jgi:ankyrin repeat protein
LVGAPGVKIAAEAGIDVNAANSNRRTALDGANSLGYENVVKFLVEKGAKFGRSSAGKPEPPEKSPEPSDK